MAPVTKAVRAILLLGPKISHCEDKKKGSNEPFFIVSIYLLIICQPVEPELVPELQQVSQGPEPGPEQEPELQQASGPPLSSGIL